MSTLGSLLALLGQNDVIPYNQQEALAIRNQAGDTSNRTSLLALQEAQRQREAEARMLQYFQQHPQAALGGPAQGPPQSALGGLAAGPQAPMTQQAVMPGQPPGASQVVPGGQDLSRFAGVSPQGGGPIQADLARQVMPQMTPPQSALGGLAAPAQPNPLEALMRQDPRAAFLVQKQQQAQQEQVLKSQAGILEARVKVAEGLGRDAQGVKSQEDLDSMRQRWAQIDPQMAAELPRVYMKDAMAPVIKRAVSVTGNAQLQLETWKNQIEMQKAGLQGEPAAMVSELRTMGVKPLQATTDQRVQAQKNIQQREVEQKEKEGLASAQARTEGEKQARLDKTVSEAFGERTTKLYDAQTGQTVDSRMKVKDYEAMPQGRVKELSTNQAEIMENVNTSIPVIAQLQTHIDKLYGPGGVLARMTSDERADLAANPQRWAQQYAQKYPELSQAQRFINSNASALARALQGEKGAMAEGDVARAKEMLPQLETSLKVWPPSQIGMQSPDTRAVALRSMNSVVDLINGRVRTLLGNEQFQHPKLHRYETADDAQQATGGPGTPPTVQPPELPIPPLVGPNPTLPQPGAFGAPEQRRYVPPAPTAPPVTPAPAPATRPAPPTARSTPAQDEAYRQSQAPAGTRLAGAPKYMDLSDVQEAMRQTGKSRREIEARARELGYTVYGSKLKLPEVTMVG